MLNLKTFVPTAAFVFTGYGLTACDNDSQNLAADPIQQPAPVFPDPEPPVQTAVPEPKSKPIELALEGHPLASEVYRRLKNNGATLERLDQGCHQKEEIVGAGDRKVEACEVYEFALDNYQAHIFAARAVTGGIPVVFHCNKSKTCCNYNSQYSCNVKFQTCN